MQPVLSNRWGFSLLSALISLLAIGLFAFATLIWQLPSVKILKDTHFQAPLRVFTQQGDLIAEFVSAMTHGIGLNKILGTIHIYPTMAEANKYVAGNWKKAHKPEKVLMWLEKFHAWRR